MHAGHDMHDHSHHDPNAFKKQFWFAFALTVPAVYFSHAIQMLFGYSALAFPFSNYIPAVAGLVLFFTGGRIFLTTGWQEIKSRQPGMMALIAMALVVAFGYSLALTNFELVCSSLEGMDFWWELASLVTIMLLGHWIEMSSIMRAQNSMENLVALMPKTAELLVDGDTEIVQLAELRVGDVVLVRPGASVPADGVIVQGSSYLNEAMITGESSEVFKAEGEQVIAGTINSTITRESLGALTVRITAVGSDTMVSGIMRLVADAQKSKSKSQVLADRAASLLFYVALIAAIITAVVWVLVGTRHTGFHSRARGNRARNCLPSCVGSCGSASDRNHLCEGGSKRPTHSQSNRLRKGSSHRRCFVRQDRHAHHWQTQHPGGDTRRECRVGFDRRPARAGCRG